MRDCSKGERKGRGIRVKEGHRKGREKKGKEPLERSKEL